MSKGFNPVSAWWETARAMNDAALTIGIRNIDMVNQVRRGDVVPSAESLTMVNEKVLAVGEGIVSASALWWRMALAPASIPYDAAPELAMAFVTPGFKKVSANAKRLSRRKTR